MEYWPLLDIKSTIKIPKGLKKILIDFTVKTLIKKPETESIEAYAADYFKKLLEAFILKQRSKFEADEDTIEDSGQLFIYGQSSYDCSSNGSGSEGISGESYSSKDLYTNGIEEPSNIFTVLKDDFEEEIPYTRPRGTVVCSSAYNPEKDKSDLQIIKYEKTDEQRIRLQNDCKKCLLFRALDDENLGRIIDAMFPKDIQIGEDVIQQYDYGDNFYVIECGTFQVLMSEGPDEPNQEVFKYENEGTFGELALMYNMPRAATVRATSKGRVWALDHESFRQIVLSAAFKKRKRYEDLISKVPMLQELTPYERMNLADALLPKTYRNNERVFNEGDEPDGMYFIEYGEVNVVMKDKEKNYKKITLLGEGEYFGELALIKSQPRAATVEVAKDDTKLAFLDVAAFERILGPCMDIIVRNVNKYLSKSQLL